MTEADYIAKLKDFEGYTDYMYLDSKGNVTIGVGILLASAGAAKSAGITFKNQKTKKRQRLPKLKRIITP
jgi:GH24 family phage-related lysozyme (muramidase)